jgi:hypothetical protein
MADQTAESSREQRQEARERRRSLTAEPFERLDEAAGDESSPGDGSSSVLKQTLATAAAGAVAAAIAGAAKAFHDREGADDDAGDDEAHGADHGAGGAPAAVEEPSPSDDESPPEDEVDEGDEPETATDPRAEADAEQEPSEEPEPEPEPPSEDGESRAPVSAGDAKEIVEKARTQLKEVLDVDPESVSGFERTDDGWKVSLEVVEVRRVPDSTDVLSSYEVTLDGDGNLLGANQTRRYRRSQVEEG